ncbi:cytochrome c biogenesis protein CcdC [Paenibacillus sp. N1-5-1-14]|uniref:cytochrome c biogenesis protein CcdC n=1 Tax=Paenibacillus radicibacter TaxID=2972488 RepID=UPI0021591ABA|nr:cytochrome c biogenesis protein CcdC [Paenibacillus radicibacter]MCR8644934.1 cytochrome c biogenesis protein CcdC [Paenibacillus radicibacter]
MDVQFDTSSMGSASISIIVVVAILILWRRTKSMYRPMSRNPIRILTPLLFLIPGLLFLEGTIAHLSVNEIVYPALIGFVMSIPLILTTSYEIREDGHIYSKKSIAFFVTFLIILSLRFFLRSYIQELDAQNFFAIVLIMGICYLVPWRIASFIKFLKILEESKEGSRPISNIKS